MDSLIQPEQALKRDTDGYLHRTVQELFSLEGRTIVITGGARGIGLSLAFAIAEAGGNVAILDALEKPHEHFHKLQKEFNAKVMFYR
jgi:sorbose reductase